MSDIFPFLKIKALSNDLEERVEAIDELIQIIGKAGDILLESVQRSNDRLILTDRISGAFSKYIRTLNEFLKDRTNGMDFWAASLLANYEINNPMAEKILLDAVRTGPNEEAETAAIILNRVKNGQLVGAINERNESKIKETGFKIEFSNLLIISRKSLLPICRTNMSRKHKRLTKLKHNLKIEETKYEE